MSSEIGYSDNLDLSIILHLYMFHILQEEGGELQVSI